SGTDVTSSTTVRAGGSSSVFNSALAGSFWLPRNRSASNKMSTLRSDSIGARAASGRMRSRTSSRTRYEAPAGSNSTTSGCTPRWTSRRPRSSSLTPISIAANPRAASSTPEPRGPTRRYACAGRAAARSSVSSARSWPTTPANVVMCLLCFVVRTARLRKEVRDRLTDVQLHVAGRNTAVDDTPAAIGGQLPIRGSHTSVELVTRALEPVAHRDDARLGEIVGHVEHDDDVGHEPARCDGIHPLDCGDSQPPSFPLIRKRRRRVAVADH